MSPAYDAAAWQSCFQAVVAAAAALLGLLVPIRGHDGQLLGAELLADGLVIADVTVGLESNPVRRLPVGQRGHWLARDMTYDLGVVAISIAGLGLVRAS